MRMLDEYHEWFDPFINGSWFNEALNRGATSYGKRELEYFGYPVGYFDKNYDLILE
ncbi:hypothetical protein MNBD_GAMMA08-1473 [hydrothermal vent metagenome]|uniref:Uncharacterized protein n=1 Tax=hydrothermal vent metagenome TaxID=652676 RepID=A0A3B0XQQ4_9ZZZZ